MGHPPADSRCLKARERLWKVSTRESTRGPAISVAEDPRLRKKVALKSPNSVARLSGGMRAEAIA
jgi:hypothetical protein